MQFTFNEGHIQLPSQWQDQSMQVLVSTDNSGINLVITREAVPQGTLTPEQYQETLALYQGKLDGYTEHACREITLAEAPAWLLDYSWNGPEDEGNQGRISQIPPRRQRQTNRETLRPEENPLHVPVGQRQYCGNPGIPR